MEKYIFIYEDEESGTINKVQFQEEVADIWDFKDLCARFAAIAGYATSSIQKAFENDN